MAAHSSLSKTQKRYADMHAADADHGICRAKGTDVASCYRFEYADQARNSCQRRLPQPKLSVAHFDGRDFCHQLT